jgi:hypothetical protein
MESLILCGGGDEKKEKKRKTKVKLPIEKGEKVLKRPHLTSHRSQIPRDTDA